MEEITQIPIPQVISSDKDTHFTGALAQNAMETEDITGLDSRTGVVESVVVQSDQNLDWDVYFWATDGHDDTDLDLDYLLGKVSFVASDGKQIAGANQYYYTTASGSQPFRPFPYVDKDVVDADDGGSELHIGLVNRNSTSKNAGATGEVTVRVVVRGDELIHKANVI